MDTQLIEEEILARARDLFALNCLEGGIVFPDAVVHALAPPLMRTAIIAAREYFAEHPELVEVSVARCLVCSELIRAMDYVVAEGTSFDGMPNMPEQVAVPCGHLQPSQ